MLVFLLALLLCEALAEPSGERPVHPVPEELFLRSFLVFPGGPALTMAAVPGHDHGSMCRNLMPCQSRHSVSALCSAWTHNLLRLHALLCRPLRVAHAVNSLV